MIAYGVISACMSAIARLYYAAKTQDSMSRTSLLGKSMLWILSEITSGILAVCLPLSLKFFRSLEESSVWLRLRSTLQCFCRLKFPALRAVGTHSGEQAATKGSGRWSTVKARLNKFSHFDNWRGPQNERLTEMSSIRVISTPHTGSTIRLQTLPFVPIGSEGSYC